MAAYDGFDDVQPQTPAVPVLGAALVQLVEPVKDQLQLLRRDGLALVGDGNIGLVPALPDGKPQVFPLRAELYGIIQQIVNYLGNVVLIGEGHYRVLGHIHVHVDMLVVDLLFEGQQHLSGAFLQIEVDLLLVRNTALALEPGNVQHAPHQPAQPFGLIGDDVQIVLPPVLRNGSVQNAVNVAGDGSHGGFQLVRNIGHKFLPLVLALLQGGRHIVEGQCQLRHFLAAVILHLDPGFQIPMTEGIGSLCHLLQGTAGPPGGQGHRHHRQRRHHQGAEEENFRDLLQNGVHTGHRGGNDHDARRRAVAARGDGHGHQKALVVIQPPDQPGSPVGAVLNYLI